MSEKNSHSPSVDECPGYSSTVLHMHALHFSTLNTESRNVQEDCNILSNPERTLGLDY